MAKAKADWVKVKGPRGEFGFCTRCGGTMPPLRLPMSLKAAAMYMAAFVEEHLYCKEVTQQVTR